MKHAVKCIAPVVLLLLIVGPSLGQDSGNPDEVLIHRDADGKLVNPLATMPPERLAAVRCVVIAVMTPEVSKCLARLDLARVRLRWSAGREDKALPEFPAGTRHLEIRFYDYNNPRFTVVRDRDMSSLAKLTELRTLDSVAPECNFDLAWIAGSRHLTTLRLRGMRVRSLGLISKLAKITHLDLSRCAILDLEPVAKLPAIATVDASFSRVRLLPSTAMPSLRVLRLAGSETSDESVAAFRSANPECRVFHRWGEILATELFGVDRVRVLRSGGKDAPLVAEVSGAKEARALIESIEFQEDLCFDRELQGGGQDGGPVLEFLRGDTVLGRVRVTAAPVPDARVLVLDWPEVFPGPGTLTRMSADLLVAWLAARGESGPERRLDVLRREQAPVDRRWQTYRRYIPEVTLRWLHTMCTQAWIPHEFTHAYPDPVERARAWLLLFGGHEGSWNRDVALDEELVRMLSTVDRRIFARAAVSAAGSNAGTNGLARWLFGEQKMATLDARTLRKLLPPAARLGLASPRRINRQRTMDALARVGSRDAKALLRDVASGKIRVRKLDDAERREIDARPPYRQEEFPAERDVPDAEYARERLKSR